MRREIECAGKARRLLLRSLFPAMLFCFCFLPSEAAAQDPLPQIAASEHPLRKMKPLREMMNREALKVPVQVMFPAAFRGTGHNEIADSLALLSPFLERAKCIWGFPKIRYALSTSATVMFAGIFIRRLPARGWLKPSELYRMWTWE